MIKTLHITGVAAVLLAGVVLASVLGFLQPASLLHLKIGARSDKQVENILGGPSAVERFRGQNDGKASASQDTTPPLVKQAGLFADFINPRAPQETPVAVMSGPLPPRQKLPTPPVTSAKFDLCGICYSSNPKLSFAYVRLGDKTTYEWVEQGREIGYMVIKEIRKNSIVCWDGSREVEIPVEEPPETSTVLLTGNTSSAPAMSEPPRGLKGKASSNLVAPSAAPRMAAVSQTPAAPVPMTPGEQQGLSDLANRLKASAGSDPAERAAVANKLITDYKSSRVSPEEAERLGTLGEQLNESPGAWKDTSKEDRKREYLRRLSLPRSSKN